TRTWISPRKCSGACGRPREASSLRHGRPCSGPPGPVRPAGPRLGPSGGGPVSLRPLEQDVSGVGERAKGGERRVTLGQVAELVDGEVVGDPRREISRVVPLEEAG